jgi:hypothetical protein
MGPRVADFPLFIVPMPLFLFVFLQSNNDVYISWSNSNQPAALEDC